jgi:flagellar hook-basal body complex protein FliE
VKLDYDYSNFGFSKSSRNRSQPGESRLYGSGIGGRIRLGVAAGHRSSRAVAGRLSTATTELLQGDRQDVHNVMISVEKADVAFQLMMQVRNKIVSAYQEISRMQF